MSPRCVGPTWRSLATFGCLTAIAAAFGCNALTRPMEDTITDDRVAAAPMAAPSASVVGHVVPVMMPSADPMPSPGALGAVPAPANAGPPKKGG